MRHTVRTMVHDAGGLGEVLIAASEAQRLYIIAKASYLEARRIVEPRLDGLSAVERIQVERMDALARKLDRSFQVLFSGVEGRDISPILGDLLAVAATVARVVVLR